MKKLQELKQKREDEAARRAARGESSSPGAAETTLSLPDAKNSAQLLSTFKLKSDPDTFAAAENFMRKRKTEYQEQVERRKNILKKAREGIDFIIISLLAYIF